MLQRRVAVTGRCPRRSPLGAGRRGWRPPYGARPQRAARARFDLSRRRISSAYRKSHTCWQHRAAFNGGVSYTERARTAPRRIRIRKSREWRASSSSRDSSSSTVPPIHVPRGERPGSLSEAGGATSTGRLRLGEADGAIPDGTTVFHDGVAGKLNSDLLGAVRRAAADAAGDGGSVLCRQRKRPDG